MRSNILSSGQNITVEGHGSGVVGHNGRFALSCHTTILTLFLLFHKIKSLKLNKMFSNYLYNLENRFKGQYSFLMASLIAYKVLHHLEGILIF